MAFVGIIANPASGKDIRRLVAHGSVFDNQEKVRIVRRVVLGLMAVGVERICYMPDYFGIVRRAVEQIKIDVPVFPLNFKTMASQEDSIEAGRRMADRGVDCIVTLGGDGTNRAVVKGSAAIPLLPISTGTNNVFPSMVEGTIAGLAAALVANKLVPLEEAAVHSTMLEVRLDGQPVDLALVDAVVYDDRFIGSRAVWDMDKVRQIFLNRAEPYSIGLSGIGGQWQLVRPEEPRGLCLTLGPGLHQITPIPPSNRGWGAEILGETRSWTDFGPQAYSPYAEEPTGQCPEPIPNRHGRKELTATKFGLANGSGTFPPGNERCSQELRASFPGGGGFRITAAVAPGLIKTIELTAVDSMSLDQDWTIACMPSVLALDGEREIEVDPGRNVSIRLIKNGPIVVDVARTMASALKHGVFVHNGSEQFVKKGWDHVGKT